MSENLNLLFLLSGSSAMAFIVLLAIGIRILIEKKLYKFQKILGILYVYWSMLFLNNLWMFVLRNSEINNWINTMMLTFDYIAVGGVGVFAYEMIKPRHYSNSQLSLFVLPYIIFSLLFIFFKNDCIYKVEQYFAIIYSIVLIVPYIILLKKYDRYIKENYSNHDNVSLSWIKLVVKMLFIVFTLFIIEAEVQFNNYSYNKYLASSRSVAFDVIYNLLVPCILTYVAVKVMKQKEVVMGVCDSKDYKTKISFDDLSQTMRDKEYFLDNELTLSALAVKLGTNRTYLSEYINKKYNSNFSDYINCFRLEKSCELLKTTDLSIEDVAFKSGFQSYSTFRRAFIKQYKISPSNYRRS